MSVVWKGVDEIRAAMAAWAGQAKNAVNADALEEASRIAVDSIKAHAPVRTGRLRDSIVADPAESRSGKPTVQIGPSRASGAFYGRMIEFGTSTITPRPWLRPGLRAVRRQVNNALADTIGARLRTRTRGKPRKKAP